MLWLLTANYFHSYSVLLVHSIFHVILVKAVNDWLEEITFVSSLILVVSENVISNTLHFIPYLFSHDLSFFFLSTYWYVGSCENIAPIAVLGFSIKHAPHHSETKLVNLKYRINAISQTHVNGKPCRLHLYRTTFNIAIFFNTFSASYHILCFVYIYLTLIMSL